MLRRKLVARIDRARVGLHPLQQVGDLDVRVAVLGVLHLRALAEQRVGLVEEQDRVGALGRGEDPRRGSSPSRRCTWSRSSPGRPGTGPARGRARAPARPSSCRSRTRPRTAPSGPALGHAALVAPVGQHLVAVAEVGRDRAQRVELAVRHHEVVPRVRRPQPRPACRGATTTPRARPRRGRGRGPARPAPASAICPIESRNFALTSVTSSTPVSSRQAAARSPNPGGRTLGADGAVGGGDVGQHRRAGQRRPTRS